MITEYGVRLPTGVVFSHPAYTLVDYIRLAGYEGRDQVVFRLVGEWEHYTGERSDPLPAQKQAETQTEIDEQRRSMTPEEWSAHVYKLRGGREGPGEYGW